MASRLTNLVDALTAPVQGQKKRKRGNNSQKGQRKAQRVGGTPAGGPRGMRARNNASRGFVRRDNMLDLTRDQFTATSPLNLFSVGAGSTPGGVRVRGRELIGAVQCPTTTGTYVTSIGFPGGVTNNSPVNPTIFPRLSAYSPIYEYFKFHKLTYLFQSNQPTTAAGEIIMSIDYDPTDAAPTTAIQQMRNISSTMANVYSDASLQMLGSLSRLPKYETSPLGFPEALQQIQASLCVGIEGFVAAAATVVGYVIADYDVEFFTPQ